MADCSAYPPASFEFPPDEVRKTSKNGGLLSIEIEFSLRCNYRCPYCYVPRDSDLENELSQDQFRDIILQAKDLGAKKIIILGGEPTLYPGILEMIDFIRGNDMQVEMFTNGSLISEEFARQLHERKVRLVLKMNTFKEETQDLLTGMKGATQAIYRAIENLKRAGYPAPDAQMAVSTIMCRHNIDELTDLWQWLRDQGVLPYFEMITPQENAKQNEWLYLTAEENHKIFEDIARIDKERYGIEWDPQPPLVSNRCLRHQFSCLVTSRGDVMPCVGVTIPIGNLRESTLKNILRDSEIIQDLRNYRNTIQGPCRTCDKSEHCYGCRGAAYQMTGNYLASDPLCWRNADRLDEILNLPVGVEKLIPHRKPMRSVDQLVSVGDRRGEITLTVTEDIAFKGEDGVISEAAYPEMIAQAAAALNGFKQFCIGNTKPEGFLLGVKNLEILGSARVGDSLRVSVFKSARFGGFGVVEGSVWKNGQLLARGELTVWHNEEDEDANNTQTG